MKSATGLAAALAAALALGGCATDARLRDSEKLAIYEAHAGVPVDSFQYFGSINGWTPLGDSAIALWTRPREAWLLDLYGPCPDIPYAPAISVSNQMGRVSARFDKVLARGSTSIDIPCAIRQIRPLDVKAIRQAERVARDQPADSGT
ncbi:MAG: DUF6491 family protein [Luteimonas sp.]